MYTFVEYIWIDAENNYRSKTKVYNKNINKLEDVEVWNFDGSSTNQNKIKNNTEVVIKPVCLKPDPFRGGNNKLVLCECYDPSKNSNDELNKTNTRKGAEEIFNKNKKLEPWFGMEQEYFILDKKTKKPIGLEEHDEQGTHYCGVGNSVKSISRAIMEHHLQLCMRANINMSGCNVEVAPGQLEYQVGPCIGINMGDELHLSRYILYRVGEIFNVDISFHPKPIKSENWNGSGCHTNFSTKRMRDGTKNKEGIYYILTAIEKLEKKHNKHIENYGIDNNLRMSGNCETSSYDKFSYSVGGRDVSIRIGNETFKNKKGYFEDRRPSSNCDPYIVTSLIYETCCL